MGYKERPDSRQSKKIKNDYNNRKDLNLGGAGNNPRNYKHKKQQAKKKGYHGKGRDPHAKMKKNWKTSSSVSGDKYKNSGVGNMSIAGKIIEVQFNKQFWFRFGIRL